MNIIIQDSTLLILQQEQPATEQKTERGLRLVN
jgi:hypothetical protein